MDSNFFGTDSKDLLSTALHESTADVLVVDPTRPTLEALIDVVDANDGGAVNDDENDEGPFGDENDTDTPDGTDSMPRVRVLADAETLKPTLGDFLVASRAADLIDTGRLSVRTLAATPTNALLLTDETVAAVVEAGDRLAGLVTDDEGFLSSAHEHYGARWRDAEPYGLRTPSISRVRETLSTEIGEATRADFDAVLDSLETARGDDGLDEVTISLLVAARNEVLLYDISKWGEDVGIASKATFSRAKTGLEEAGLIATEKVPIDVGRPRLRLTLGDERLASAPIEEFAAIALEELA